MRTADPTTADLQKAVNDAFVAMLYAAVADDRLSWLDGLLIDAELRRRCACGAIAGLAQPCDVCATPIENDATEVTNYFTGYRAAPELTLTVPPVTADDPELTLAIAAVCSGTPGEAYADNNWIYGVWVDGSLVYSGADLCAGLFPKTHHQMVILLAAHVGEVVLPQLGHRLDSWADTLLGSGAPDA